MHKAFVTIGGPSSHTYDSAIIGPTAIMPSVEVWPPPSRARPARPRPPAFLLERPGSIVRLLWRSHLALAVCLHMPLTDAFTFPLAFRLCSLLSAFAEAVSLHAHLVKLGPVGTSVRSLNALVTLYSNSVHLHLARQLFDQIPNLTVSSWSAMIAGYDRNLQPLEALFTFLKMLEAGVCPDEAALVSTLAACTHGGCLEFGKAIHAYTIVYGLGLGSVGFGTALLDLYAKCGELDIARKVFERTAERNVLTWSAMIGGLAMHGLGLDAIKLFDEMTEVGVRPTSVTMTDVLSACSHAGLVDEGLRYFKLMREEYGIEPRVEHCGYVVDLLGRAALLNEAQEFVRTMPMAATAAIWRSLLGAACTHGELEVGRPKCSTSMDNDKQR